MARRTEKQKVERVIAFLAGVRDGEVQGILTRHGLTQAVLEEAQQAIAGVLQLCEGDDVAAGGSLVARMRGFAREWFPLLSAALQRRFPEVCEWLFRDLRSKDCVGAALRLQMFAQRFELLAAGASPFGDRGREARALLALRGFDTGAQEQLHALLVEFSRFEGGAPVAGPELSEAVAALWTWYLEWSGIARVAIKDLRLLRALGFVGRPGRRDATALNVRTKYHLVAPQ